MPETCVSQNWQKFVFSIKDKIQSCFIPKLISGSQKHEDEIVQNCQFSEILAFGKFILQFYSYFLF